MTQSLRLSFELIKIAWQKLGAWFIKDCISYISLHDTVSSAILLTEDELVTTKWENRFMKFITYGWQATSWVDDGLGI